MFTRRSPTTPGRTSSLRFPPTQTLATSACKKVRKPVICNTPVIPYFHTSANDLKVHHCVTLGVEEASPSCTLLFAEKMARVSSRGSAPLNLPPSSSSDPPGRVFSDDELSEIFQIDFGQIFGNPEAGLKSSYKGIQSKKGLSRSNSSSRTGTLSVDRVSDPPMFSVCRPFPTLHNRPDGDDNNKPIRVCYNALLTPSTPRDECAEWK